MSVPRLLLLPTTVVSVLCLSLAEHTFSYHQDIHEDSLAFSPSPSSFLDIQPSANDQTWNAIQTGTAPVHFSKVHKKPKAFFYGVENSFVNITCEVSANPGAELQWKFRGEELQISSKAACKDETKKHCLSILMNGDNFSILQMKVQQSTLGEYTCRASNELGASERNFFVRMGTKPPVPGFVTEIVPKQGILVKLTSYTKSDRTYVPKHKGQEVRKENGEILPVLGFTIQMRKFGSCEYWRNITTRMENQRKLIQHNLHPGTVYRMRLAAWTEVGRGEFSRAKTVRYDYRETEVPDSDDDDPMKVKFSELISDHEHEADRDWD